MTKLSKPITITDGGPAFPVHPEAHLRSDAECARLSGMSLRDAFAVSALPVALKFYGSELTGTTYEENVASLVGVAYDFADAMLSHRTQSATEGAQ